MFNKTVIAALVFIGLVSTKCSNNSVIWHEGENFTGSNKNVEQRIGTRPPASGGLALNGTGIGGSGVGTFSAIGRGASFLVNLDHNIADAKIIFRYARLQWRADMKPAEFICEVKNAGNSRQIDLTFNDTKGWGTNGPEEWKLLNANIGELNKGPTEIKLTVTTKDGDITLDGFFIAPVDFNLDDNEFNGLSRIKIDNSGYIGINLPFSAIEQNDFKGFDIAVRSFGDKKWDISSFLINQKGIRTITLLDKTNASHTDSMKINIKPESLRSVEDGDYTLVVSFNNGKDSLLFPFNILGNTIMEAEKKKKEYRDFIVENDTKSNPVWRSVAGDIKYATDYIENTIGYLRSKSGHADEDVRKKALSYFEKARNRSAQTFGDDIRKIISQNDETISRIKNGKDPYVGRSGDFRRAFVSSATGKLEPYRINVPPSNHSTDKVPVMLVLHGGGGDENYYPDLDEGMVPKILEREGIIMVSPRATSWYKDDGAKDMAQLVKLILQEYPNADKSRVYSTGVSAGGFGTYNLAVEYPGLFAAIACVSGSARDGDISRIKNLKNTPCLLIHGGSDPVIPVENAITTSDRLKELGYPYELKIFPTHGHGYYSEEYMNLTLDFIKRFGK